jgi:hypothetical protein
VSADELLELSDECRLPADGEICIDAILQRCKPRFGQAGNRGLSESLVEEVGQRRSSPEGKRVAQGGGSHFRVLFRCGLVDESLEALAVELAATDMEHVARRSRLQDAVCLQGLPQL